MSYRNAVYNSKEQCVHLFTWDANGNRIKVDATYHPYLYLENPRGDKTSIYGTKVKKRDFNNSYERYKFLNDSSIKRVYENLPPVQQFLIDSFSRENETPEFSEHPIKIMFVDIETYSEKSFPDVDNPDHPVTVITCYDSITKHYTTFGCGAYENNDDDVTYHNCRTEKAMFLKYIAYLNQDFPDIISGWNSEVFDIPYLIARCELLFGADEVNEMSPLRKVYYRMKKGRFGKEIKRYYMDGVSSIDYLDVYSRFCMTLRESYKLDAIGELELGQKKLDYGDMSLAELTKKDWQKFVQYNIQDVRLLVALEEKLQYMSLVRMLAYVGCTTFEGAMGTIQGVTGAMTIKARKRKEILPTFVRQHSLEKNPGAFVSFPKTGFSSKVVSFDANSLYPNVMIALNLSPETKIGRVERGSDNKINIYHISGKHFNLTAKQFKEFLKREECAMTKAGFLFSQKKVGIIPEFLDDQYAKRVEIKKELFAERQKERALKDEIEELEAQLKTIEE